MPKAKLLSTWLGRGRDKLGIYQGRSRYQQVPSPGGSLARHGQSGKARPKPPPLASSPQLGPKHWGISEGTGQAESSGKTAQAVGGGGGESERGGPCCWLGGDQHSAP